MINEKDLYGLADDFYDTVFIIFLVNVIFVWENRKYITLSAFGCKYGLNYPW